MDMLDVLERASSTTSRAPYVRRPVQQRRNPLEELDDDAFYARFRFTKTGARYIFSLIEDKFVVPRKWTNNPMYLQYVNF
jgi:hypothetical protein